MFFIQNIKITISKNRKEAGIALIDALVGVFLIAIIFLGIVGAYLLGLKVVSQSKSRIDATSLANEKIEAIRNLSYGSVGVIGGYPSGGISPVETVIRNGVNYTVTTRIDFTNDSFDGISGDSCPNDYKKVDVQVSWSGQYSGNVDLLTDITPKGISQECAEVGGTLSVAVFDASGISITGANVDVKDVISGLEKTCITNSGACLFVLPESVETYKVSVSKNGYNSDRTYAKNEQVGSVILANPAKPHATIFEGQVTSISFSIDLSSSLGVNTQTPETVGYWIDIFSDQSEISSMSNVSVADGEVKLSDPSANPSGYLISTTIAPAQLIAWRELSFDDYEPANSTLKYQVLYYKSSGQGWVAIPNNDLDGNYNGFGTSPVDISGLSVSSYPQIRLKANFTSSNPPANPTLYGWTISWAENEPLPIPNVAFYLQGAKTLGTDSAGKPVYKNFGDYTSNGSGYIDISGLEWDSYNFSVNKSATGFDLTSTSPIQPVNVLPDTIQSVALNLKAENTLLATVKNSVTYDPIFGASVRVYNVSLGYDQILPTDQLGKAFFMPLKQATYNLEVQIGGYSTYLGTVSVSGSSAKNIYLIKI